jgi:polyhydroxyalkanoate synthesis regulator phasin
MNLNKKLAVAVSGAILLMAGQYALADSSTDIVDALVSKGVLTEEEGKLISKGAKSKSEADAKANKSRISVGSFIDNATMYGDIRVRHEYRAATDAATSQEIDTNRERYKLTLGIKTEAKNWYSDLAFAMGSKGRSDNATFGSESSTNGFAFKEGLYVKRAMLGWKATDWLSLEAGRIANPLYTTPMVWDADLTFDGATAKAKFKTGESSIFVTAAAFQYMGFDKQYSGTTRDQTTNNIGVIQAGFETPFTSELKGKAAVSYYTYGRGNFTWSTANGSSVSDTNTGTAYLNIIEVPAELSYKVSSSGNIKLYGDWVINTDADKRADLAGDTTNARDDDTAWLLGVEYKNQKDKTPSEGDFKAAIWYQETGLYALDPNAVDSDFFDSKINVKGAVFKGEYLVADNVYLNMAYGHGTRKNANRGVSGILGDTGYAFKDFDLLQLDLTYKF